MSLQRVVEFAKALDVDDFEGASAYLLEDCTYDSPSGRITGARRILDAYAGNAAWAREAFESLEFRSEVVLSSPRTATITYTDITHHAGFHHTYQCRQIATFDERGVIVHIAHEEIEGEREALAAFMERIGVTRDGAGGIGATTTRAAREPPATAI